jgi:hypothetical protein
MKLRHLMAIAALGSAATAQNSITTPSGEQALSVDVALIENVGTLELATGVITPPPTAGAQQAIAGIAYDNTCFPYATAPCNSVILIGIAPGQIRMDSGRIPSTTSPAPNVGAMDAHRFTSFQLAYCTTESDTTIGGPGARFTIFFWENYDGCVEFTAAGAATKAFNLTLPGTLTAGAQRCVLININLVGGFEFTMKSDADGAFTTGAAADENFGWGLGVTTQTAGTTNSIILAGQDPAAPGSTGGCPFGDHTYFHNPGATAGTGLDNDNNYWLQTSATAGTCFAGPASNTLCPAPQNGPIYGSFYLQLTADLTDCNNNKLPDADDISGGASLDSNLNGIPDECEAVPYSNYCTAGTTTNGCLASMSAVGSTSISTASGFIISCTSVEGAKQGIIFYGNHGQIATPWHNSLGQGSSFLCVKSPSQRTGNQVSGGTLNACDGTLSLDFFAYIAAHPTALGNPFSAGTSIDVQSWFRDPPSPKTTNLSDGLHVTFFP